MIDSLAGKENKPLDLYCFCCINPFLTEFLAFLSVLSDPDLLVQPLEYVPVVTAKHVYSSLWISACQILQFCSLLGSLEDDGVLDGSWGLWRLVGTLEVSEVSEG